MRKNYWLGSLAALFLTPVMADTIPAELEYHQKPIDPLCFEEAESTAHIVSLTTCGVAAEKDRYISGKSENLVKEGYTGYEYKQKDTGQVPGYSYYKVIGKLNGGELIYTVNSGGGSGEFTALKWVTRKNDTLTIEILNQGDRCNNGIEDVAVKNGAVTYQINLTPFDFFTLTNDNPHNLRAYDDLAACAACCAGKALFSRPLDKNYQNQKLVSVDFSNYSLAPTDDPNATRYQLCFDKQIAAARAQGLSQFTPAQLHAFTKGYNEECFKKKG